MLPGYNHNYSESKETKLKRILVCVKNHPEGVYPKTVSRETNINHSTVKVYLSLLLKMGDVQKMKTGLYSATKETDGVQKLPKMQNVILTYVFEKEIGIEHEERGYDFGLANCNLMIGMSNRKATFVIGAEPPISIETVIVLANFFSLELEKRIGHRPSNRLILIKSAEFNRDYYGVKVDGANCITLEGLIGLEKLYQKKGRLRNELRVNFPLTLDSLLLYLNHGVKGMDFVCMCKGIMNKIEDLEESVIARNSAFYEIPKLLKILIEKINKVGEECDRTKV